MGTIVCSHGFGVGADDRGLFTDIAAALPGYEFVLFDYNDIDSEGNLTVRYLEAQTRLLDERLAGAGRDVILLCHSQGCIIAGLSDLKNVSQVIFLAPPGELSVDRFIAKFASRPGAVLDMQGMSSLPRSDGSMTYVSGEYIDSIRNIDTVKLYKSLAERVKLNIITAKEDEVIGKTDFAYLGVPITVLDGGHNFLPPYRQEMIEMLKSMVV